jgi:metal-dependent amidase/aminoacylase/carboxypeptidase family protein
MGHLAATESIFPRMVELRRTLHQFPELAFHEEKTAALIMEEAY